MIPKEIEFWLFAWVRLWTLVQGLFCFMWIYCNLKLQYHYGKKVALVKDQGYQMTS